MARFNNALILPFLDLRQQRFALQLLTMVGHIPIGRCFTFTFEFNDSAVFIQRFIVSNTDNNVLKYHLSSLQDQDNGKQRNLNSKQTSIPH